MESIQGHSIQEINSVLEQVISSRSGDGKGRLYVVIHLNSGMIGTTSNKRLASSMSEIAQFVQERADRMIEQSPEAGGDAQKQIKSLQNLKKSFFTLCEQYEQKHQSILARIAHFFSFSKTFRKTSELIAKTTKHLNSQINRVHLSTIPQSDTDYGKYTRDINGKETECGLSYANYAAKRGMQKAVGESELGITPFSKLSESKINQENLINTLKVELSAHFNLGFRSDGMAVSFTLDMFNEILEKLNSEVIADQISPEEALSQFENRLKEAIISKNEETIEFDRETFRDIVGRMVKDGRGSPAKNFPSDHPDVKMLIREYNQDLWVDKKNSAGEVINPRKLTYKNMDEAILQKMDNELSQILKREEVKNVLLRFFS